MTSPRRAAQPSAALRLTTIASALAIALFGGSQVVAATHDARIPASWPLPYERTAQTTPLAARMQSMRNSRPAPAGHLAASLVVTSCVDDNSAGSLRERVDTALSGDTVDLSQLSCSTITLAQGALKIEVDDLRFRGPGAAALTIDGNELDRVIYHDAGGTLTIEDLTIAHGRFVAEGNDVAFGGCVATAAYLVLTDSVVRDCHATGVGSYGGAVLSGPLTMTRSTISGSTAFGDHPTNGTAAYGGGAFVYGATLVDSVISGNSAIGTHNPPLTHWEIGGGLFIAHNGGTIERSTISDNFAIRFAGGVTQEGDLVLRNSTISGNSTRDDDGGGLRVRQVTSVSIENSTITNNRAGSFGGGVSFIANALPSVAISSIIAGNQADSAADASSTAPLALSGNHNLIGSTTATLALPTDTLRSDPQLLPLADNGGATRTHAIAAESPAIDAGVNPAQLTTDQRGGEFVRAFGGGADIGAYERQAPEGNGVEAVMLPGPGVWACLLLALGLMISAVWRDPGSRRAISGCRPRR